jgi:hypothetical protein
MLSLPLTGDITEVSLALVSSMVVSSINSIPRDTMNSPYGLASGIATYQKNSKMAIGPKSNISPIIILLLYFGQQLNPQELPHRIADRWLA